MLRPFHLTIPVSNLDEARTFYREILGCSEGRSDSHWVDFDFYGHHLVIHYYEHAVDQRERTLSEVFAHDPIPNFGVVLEYEDWYDLKERLSSGRIAFSIVQHHNSFKGQPGKQETMFFYDPSGNALAFKAFKDIGQLFEK